MRQHTLQHTATHSSNGRLTELCHTNERVTSCILHTYNLFAMCVEVGVAVCAAGCVAASHKRYNYNSVAVCAAECVAVHAAVHVAVCVAVLYILHTHNVVAVCDAESVAVCAAVCVAVCVAVYAHSPYTIQSFNSSRRPLVSISIADS